MLSLDDKVINQSILKDSVNIIEIPEGISSIKLRILSIETEAALADTILFFDKK